MTFKLKTQRSLSELGKGMLGGEHSLAIVVMVMGKSMVCLENWKKLSYDKSLENKKGEVHVFVWPELEDPHPKFSGAVVPHHGLRRSAAGCRVESWKVLPGLLQVFNV